MDRYYPLTVTVPAATPVASPIVVPYPLETGRLVDIEIEIPSGHCGLTGVRVMFGDVVILPWGQGQFIVASDYSRVFDVNENIDANNLTVAAYNTDIFDHSFYLRAHVSDSQAQAATQPPAPVADNSLISAVGTLDPLSAEAILGTQDLMAIISGNLTPAQEAILFGGSDAGGT